MSLFCFILIFILHKFCLVENLNQGNFNRRFIELNIKKSKEFVLPEKAINFASIEKNHIIFNSEGLERLIFLENNKFNIKELSHKNHNSNFVNNILYSFDPSQKTFYEYEYNQSSLNLITSGNTIVGFDRAITINKDSILLRSYNLKKKNMEFSMLTLNPHKLKKLNIRLDDSLEIDGGLKTDGYFSKNNTSIIFTQYKKGNFYKISHKLDKIQRFRTLDSTELIKGLKIGKDSSFTFERPSLNVNLLTAIEAEKVYLISFVKSKNQSLKDFTKYRTVDAYNIYDGRYLYSFYLPNNKNEKPIDFQIKGGEILTLYSKKLVIYDFE